MSKPALLTFDEAQTIGRMTHDHWALLAAPEGSPPMTRDDLGWGDLVQFIWRSGCQQLAERTGSAPTIADVEKRI